MNGIDPDDLRRHLIEFKKTVTYSEDGSSVALSKADFEEFCEQLRALIDKGRRNG